MSKRMKISPKELKLRKNRRTSGMDDASLRTLGEAMRVRQLQAIVVTPDYVVVVGHRRTLAALLVGLETVEVEVLDEAPTESTVLMYQWAENFFRQDVSDWDRYEICYELLQLMPGWKGKDVADFLKVDASMIARIMCPSKGTEAVRGALRDGKICLSTCYEITKLPLEGQQAGLDLALNGGSRAAVIEQRLDKNSRRKGSGVKLTRVTVLTAAGVTVVISGANLTSEAVVAAAGEIQKEARRAVEQQFDVKTFEAVMRDRIKKSA